MSKKNMDGPVSPDFVLNVIRCRCKGDCASSLCSCQKNGLHCVTACSFCHGTECENALTASVDCDDDISDDEEDADSMTVNVESVSLPGVMYDDDFHLQCSYEEEL